MATRTIGRLLRSFTMQPRPQVSTLSRHFNRSAVLSEAESDNAGASSSSENAAGDSGTKEADSGTTEVVAADSKSLATTNAESKDANPFGEFPSIYMSRKGPAIHKKIGKIPNNVAMRDFQKRVLVAKHEVDRVQYKAMIRDERLPYEVRRYFQDKLNRLPRNSSKVRIRNRCIITGRGRGVYRRFRVSRIVIRELAFEDALSGLYKASW